MIIACNTSDESGSYGYAIMELTPKLAKALLGYREPYRYVANWPRLYCLEFFDDNVSYGSDADFEIGDEWVSVPDSNAVSEDENVAALCMKITDTGIIWSASPKHNDGYFETEELSWKVLESVAMGEDPFQPAEAA